MPLTGWETVAFYALGAWTLFAGLFVVTARKGVHGALALVAALLGVAGLFVLLRAELVAGVQVLVYAGGAAGLFLFAVILVDGAREAPGGTRRLARRTIPAVAVVVLLGSLFMVALERAGPAFPAAESRTASGEARNAEEVAEDLDGRAVLPFEIAGVVLLVAIVGVVLLARERKQEKVPD